MQQLKTGTVRTGRKPVRRLAVDGHLQPHAVRHSDSDGDDPDAGDDATTATETTSTVTQSAWRPHTQQKGRQGAHERLRQAAQATKFVLLRHFMPSHTVNHSPEPLFVPHYPIMSCYLHLLLLLLLLLLIRLSGDRVRVHARPYPIGETS